MLDIELLASIIPFLYLLPVLLSLCIAKKSKNYNNPNLAILNINILFGIVVSLISYLTFIKSKSPIINSIIFVDGLSFSMLMLNSIIYLMSIASLHSSSKDEECKVDDFLLKISSIAMICFLASITFIIRNIIFLYISFELSLVPIFIMIVKFGGKERLYAAKKILIYTGLSSLMMLGGILFLIKQYSNYDIIIMRELLSQSTDSNMNLYIIWIVIFFAVAVKTPIFPFHTWLPLAHVEAPTQCSMILAAIMLKIGLFVFIRLLINTFPIHISQIFAEMIIIISIFSALYASLIAFAQKDIKRIIAYSSISHMSYSVIGICIFAINGSKTAYNGAVFQMFSHGIISASLFMIFGAMYKQTHNRDVSNYSGIVNKAPILGYMFLFFSIANIGLPGMSSFIAEFLVTIELSRISILYTIAMLSCIVFGAIYMLNLCRIILFGESSKIVQNIKDISKTDISILSIIIFLVLILGIKPNILINIIP